MPDMSEETGQQYKDNKSHTSCELVQSTEAQVVGYDDICNGVKDKLNVVGVCSAGGVRVDLLVN